MVVFFAFVQNNIVDIFKYIVLNSFQLQFVSHHLFVVSTMELIKVSMNFYNNNNNNRSSNINSTYETQKKN